MKTNEQAASMWVNFINFSVNKTNSKTIEQFTYVQRMDWFSWSDETHIITILELIHFQEYKTNNTHHYFAEMAVDWETNDTKLIRSHTNVKIATKFQCIHTHTFEDARFNGDESNTFRLNPRRIFFQNSAAYELR